MATGFIYRWYDLKRDKYYIGSHWGSPTDKYVCSSRHMLRAYKRRPETFQREILEFVNDRALLLLAEEAWLQKIPLADIGVKSYNLIRRTGHWHAQSYAETIAKLKASWTEERKIGARQTLSDAWNKPGYRENFRAKSAGRKRSEETKQKQRARWNPERRTAQAARLSAISKNRFADYWLTHKTRKEKLAEHRIATGWQPPNWSEVAKKNWQATKADEEKMAAIRESMAASKRDKQWVNRSGSIKLIIPEDLQKYLDAGWSAGRGPCLALKGRQISAETREKLAAAATRQHAISKGSCGE